VSNRKLWAEMMILMLESYETPGTLFTRTLRRSTQHGASEKIHELAKYPRVTKDQHDTDATDKDRSINEQLHRQHAHKTKATNVNKVCTQHAIFLTNLK